MTRAASASLTRSKILRASTQLMLCRGYNSSSIDDVCEEAQVKKGAFFHHFKSKEQLAQDTLRDFLESAERGSANAPFRSLQSPLDRAIGYVDFIIGKTLNPEAPRNCLLGILGGELAETVPALRKQCLEYFEAQIAALKADLDQAKAEHGIGPEMDTQSLAEMFISTFQGAMILRRVKQDQGLVARNLEHFKKYLQSFFAEEAGKPV